MYIYSLNAIAPVHTNYPITIVLNFYVYMNLYVYYIHGYYKEQALVSAQTGPSLGPGSVLTSINSWLLLVNAVCPAIIIHVHVLDNAPKQTTICFPSHYKPNTQ